jgi:D-alanyl-D-alanine carboxypeptidase (penicillin-binding protein 5/6)
VVAVQVLLIFALASPAKAAASSSPLPEFTVSPLFPGGTPSAPAISAKAAILIDADSGKVLYSHNANARLPIASTTKIMTAIVVLETLDPAEKVTISASAVSVIGSVASLAKGEVLTVEDLLRALLIPSGNDAAVALAEAAAGSVPAFVAKMNAKAKALGLKNTHFVNDNGLTKDKHYSSAKDLATIAQYAMKFPLFRRIVGTKGLSLPTLPGQKPRRFVSKNELVRKYDWVTGVKTGSTPAAGYCVVSSATQEGVNLIAVVLGATDSATRWKEAGALLEYGFNQHPRTVLVATGQAVGELRSLDSAGEPVPLVAEGPLVARLFKSDTATGVIHLRRSGLLSIATGDIVGTIEFSANGRTLGTVRLLAAAPKPQPSLTKVLDYWRDRSPTRLVLAPAG